MLQLNQLVPGTGTLKVLIHHLETEVSVCYVCLIPGGARVSLTWGDAQSILESAQMWTQHWLTSHSPSCELTWGKHQNSMFFWYPEKRHADQTSAGSGG